MSRKSVSPSLPDEEPAGAIEEELYEALCDFDEDGFVSAPPPNSVKGAGGFSSGNGGITQHYEKKIKIANAVKKLRKLLGEYIAEQNTGKPFLPLSLPVKAPGVAIEAVYGVLWDYDEDGFVSEPPPKPLLEPWGFPSGNGGIAQHYEKKIKIAKAVEKLRKLIGEYVAEKNNRI